MEGSSDAQLVLKHFCQFLCQRCDDFEESGLRQTRIPLFALTKD